MNMVSNVSILILSNAAVLSVVLRMRLAGFHILTKLVGLIAIIIACTLHTSASDSSFIGRLILYKWRSPCLRNRSSASEHTSLSSTSFRVCFVPNRETRHSQSIRLAKKAYSYTIAPQPSRLADNQLAVLGEVVLGDLEVERRGALSYPAGDVVVRAVAGAEPSAEVAGLANGDTAQMRADACYTPSASAIQSGSRSE